MTRIGQERLLVGATPLRREQVVAVARGGAGVTLEESALDRLREVRGRIDELAESPKPVYGVSTGFGALALRHIPADRRIDLQRSLIRSHAAGAGTAVEPEVVRAMMLLRLRTLMSGHTGVRVETAQALAGLLDNGIVPVVHEYGSLGCSGDLAPLAAVALALMGEGEVLTDSAAAYSDDAPGQLPPATTRLFADPDLRDPRPDATGGLRSGDSGGPRQGDSGRPRPDAAARPVAQVSAIPDAIGWQPAYTRPAAEALAAAGLEPLVLAEKEGLALTNGTDGMLAMLLLAIDDLHTLLDVADLTAAMSVEALLGTDRVFAADLQALRPHPGQARSASHMRTALAGSEIMASHRGDDCPRVQDAYSLRCAPQVHGAARDTLAHAELVAERELASAIDNPVVLDDGRVESNGNFHGAPVGYVLDFLAIAVADVAGIAERRTDRMLDVHRSHGLPPFLADDPGVDSGYMIAQYTQAGTVSELKRLAVPASVDSIPSSAMQEDHVSMGWSAARKLRRAVDGLTTVLAIELLTAARALDLRAPLEPAAVTAAARDLVRSRVAGPGPDRHLAPDIAAVVELVRSGAFGMLLAE
ncbi:histidine ammonia-lyase [Nocardia yamanashiensis]|uniref:histidine ammonia-lyase n=1 Tax=Nocardia yamanashiensis TaxID=209247 RepID=UPI001E4E2611|nr:histidine ammonia-lyase [Nocardia yamanashiensis]UGT45116.1 histidine ammonia-lyase [Nocardia yamanashiensis]